MPMPSLKLTLERARAAMITAQGLTLGDREKATLISTLERAGFLRTLGGVEVYLALKARVPGVTRAEIDAAVEKSQAQVIPTVRGCMYLVARRHVPLGLRMAESLSAGRSKKEQEKAGIKKGEVAAVAKVVLGVLGKKGPLTTDALRRALPEGTLRNLGEKRGKAGVSSTLPPALRLLEFEGKVERNSEGGRIDTERYLWRKVKKSPFEGAKVPGELIEIHEALAEIFFRAAGVGTVSNFASWAGVSQREAKAALQNVGVIPVSIEGTDDAYFMHETKRKELERADGAAEAIVLLPFEDNLVAYQGGLGLLVDEAHHDMKISSWGSAKESTIGAAKHSALRSIVADGRIAGFWEYDPDARSVVFSTFDKLKPASKKRLKATADELSTYLAADVGHGRSFSLDTDDELRKRAEFVRKLA